VRSLRIRLDERAPIHFKDVRMEFLGSRSNFITLLVGALSLFVCVSAVAQEGYYGAGHDNWHQGFYSKLKRNDGKGPCCNLMDCRPTQSRMVGDHYEVKVDGEWLPVPMTRLTTCSRPMAVLTSALRDRWAPTRAFYFASSSRRRAEAQGQNQR
jgi:hypothetical protein